MQFQTLTFEARAALAPFFEGLSSRTCDLTLGTLLMWREVNRTEFCIEDDTLFLRVVSFSGKKSYFLPLGPKMTDAVARLLKEEGAPLRFVCVPAEYLSVFEGFSHTAEANRDYFDYLYGAEKLSALSGKKYAKKRNLIKQFERAYPEYRFETLTDRHRAAVTAFFERWMAELGASASRVEELERQGCARVLADADFCGMQGGVLFVGEKIVGFSLGEVQGDVLYTHIEKADRAYKGVYQKLTNLFVNRFVTEGVRYVNREDDSGDEGLRRAKMDYDPDALLEKYTVVAE